MAMPVLTTIVQSVPGADRPKWRPPKVLGDQRASVSDPQIDNLRELRINFMKPIKQYFGPSMPYSRQFGVHKDGSKRF